MGGKFLKSNARSTEHTIRVVEAFRKVLIEHRVRYVLIRTSSSTLDQTMRLIVSQARITVSMDVSHK